MGTSFLGIDVGTSFIKGAILDLENRSLAHIRRTPFPEALQTGNPLQCEYDPYQILNVVRGLIDELAARAPDCAGVVMCAQMHGLVLMNAGNEPVSSCITWRDQRASMQHPSGSGTYFDLVRRRAKREACREVGNELEPARPICFLFWLSQGGRLTPGVIPASLADFVLSSLCGSVPGVDVTNASGYGAYNLKTADWHHELIRDLGLDHLRWPTIRKHGEVVGCLRLGSKRVPCFLPVGDAQTALAGALLTPAELSMNISTGSQVSRLTAELNLGDYQTRPYFEGTFLNTITRHPGGRSLDLLVGLLTEITAAQHVDLDEAWSYINQGTKRVVKTDLEADLNFFPASNEGSGKIANIRGDNLTVGHLFRAAFKNMADQYYEAALQVWPEKTWQKILLSGGLSSKLAALRETIQEKFRTGYRLAPFADDTLQGLLILASVFSGRAESVEEVIRQLRTNHENTAI